MILIDGGRVDKVQKFDTFRQLESKSIFFPNSITYAPYTIGAMHAVFSGCNGNKTGTDSYWHTYKFKKNKFLTITEYLKQNGYSTFADSDSEIIIPKQGFDTFNIHDENSVNLVSHHTSLLEKMKNSETQGKNFFLYLHYSKIHTGIMNNVLKVFDNFSSEYFENKSKNEQRYDELFKDADVYLKNILQKIYELEFDKNSIIIVLSDHGTSVGEKFGERAYGAFCYDYTIKTFCYLLAPDITPKIISQQVRHIDYMPTLLEMLDIPINKIFHQPDGVSLVPLIKGVQMDETFAFSETGNPQHNKKPPELPNVKSIRSSSWKLIINEYDNTKELYNLETDPEEEKNLIDTNLQIENLLLSELKKIDCVNRT